MRHAVTVSTIFFVLTFVPFARSQDPPSDELFTPEQLDNLLAPIALYPDPLLAQILVAATFPDQVDLAAQFVRDNSNPDAIDGQSWDVSVKAVAHYGTPLSLMAEDLEWTTSLGQAYVNQPDDVMASIQRLRAQAQAAGNLASDADMEVVDDGGGIAIWPAQAQYLYVPDYDPDEVYVQPTGLRYGPGYFIGAWLNYDFDWNAHRIFYHGWERSQGWSRRSRPYIHTIDTYVSNRFQNVNVNRAIVSRDVNYGSLNRYESVHRDVGYGNSPNRDTVNIKRNDSGNNESPEPIQAPRQQRPERTQAPQPRPEANRPAAPERTAAPPREQRPAPVRQAPESRPAPRVEPSRPAPAPRAEPARSEPAHSAPAARDEGKRK